MLISFFEHYHNILRPIFFLWPWLLLTLFFSTIINAIVDIGKMAQAMHQIPCHSCRYFTNSYHLKCTIHPLTANTESAIHCLDFHSDNEYSAPQ